MFPFNIFVNENEEGKLEFPEPVTPGSHEEIIWYKGSSDVSESSLTFLEQYTILGINRKVWLYLLF